MRIYFYVLLLLWGAINALQAQFSTIATPYIFSKSDLNETGLINSLNRNVKYFKAQEISTIKADISRYNQKIQDNISGLDIQYDLLSSDLKDLLKVKDVVKLREQIAEKQKSLAQIQQQTDDQLAKITFRGIYLAVKSDFRQDEIQSLKKIGQTATFDAIAPTAIATLNGAFIQSLTTLINDKIELDRIRQKVSGTIEPGRQLYEYPGFAEGVYARVMVVNVSPCKQPTGKIYNGITANSKISVMDLVNNTSFESYLSGLPAEERQKAISNINAELASEIAGVQSANSSAKDQESAILRNSQRQSRDLAEEIKGFQQQYDFQVNRVKNILTEKNIPFNSNDIEGSVQNAINNMQQKLKDIAAQRISEKEKEIIPLDTRAEVPGEDEAHPHVAASVIALLKQFESEQNTTLKDFYQEVLMENGSISSFSQVTTTNAYRQVEQMWVYPVPASGYWSVVVAAKYKITGKKGGNTATNNGNLTGFNTQSTLFNYECVYVAGGTYTMGCTSEQGSDCDDDEKPAHKVSVNSFNIGKYEVTQAQWQAIMNTNPSSFKNCDNCPVETVSWNDIQIFIQKIKEKTGKRYRLPTEAEWEFVARGGNNSKGYKYSGSNEVLSVAWISHNSGSKTHLVGQKIGNELGIFDMSGNVWEWCEDDWHNSYIGFHNNREVLIDSPRGDNRVLRGGSWFSNAGDNRISYRSGSTPDFRFDSIGFRLVALP